MIKNFFTTLIFLIIILGIIIFVISRFSYVDLPFCYVAIEGDVLNGNKQTIFQAIKSIKSTDKAVYKDFCHYVNRIREDYCFISSVDYSVLNASGCYLKGAKTIYLKPVKESSGASIAERTNAIEKYTSYSKLFWQSIEK